MQAVERQRFEDSVLRLLAVYGKAPDKPELEVWFSVLRPHPFDRIRLAMLGYAKRGKHAPRPADLNEICERIAADEAPETAPRAESHWHWNDVLVAARIYDTQGAERCREVFDGEMVDEIARACLKGPGLSVEDAARTLARRMFPKGQAVQTREV